LLPRWLSAADPAWFGFPLTVRGGLSRLGLVRFLESRRVGARLGFSGNVLRPPGVPAIRPRVVGGPPTSRSRMDEAFFLGVYPGLTPAMRDYVLESLAAFFAR